MMSLLILCIRTTHLAYLLFIHFENIQVQGDKVPTDSFELFLAMF